MAVSGQFVAEITRCQRQLYAFILSLVWNAEEADDVLQETNLVLWQKAAEFDETRPFLPWAMRFARLQAMAWLKRRRRKRDRVVIERLLDVMATEVVTEESLFERRRRALGRCLQKLSVPQRELIAQRYEPKGSVNALAETTNTTPKAISGRLGRIRRALLLCIENSLAEATS